MGANASGKTTLAKLLCGILLPTDGNIQIAGINKNTDSLNTQIGLVLSKPQEQLIAATVEEEIAFGLENMRLPSASIKTRIEKILAELNLEGYTNRHVHNLSAGEQQRVVLAGILAMEPDCLILDEPTAFLAPDEAEALWHIIYDLNRQGATIIWLSQQVQRARGANRIMVLNNGSLVLDEPPDKALSHNHPWEEWGLNLPPIVDLGCHLAAEGFKIALPCFTVDELLTDITHEKCRVD